MAYYLDTSAAVKLVVAERDTAALIAWIADREDDVVSSDLLRTELLRATRRGAPHAMPRARAVLDSLTLLTLPRPRSNGPRISTLTCSAAWMPCTSPPPSSLVTTSTVSSPLTIGSPAPHDFTA